MSDKQFQEFLKTRQTDCPVCRQPMSAHTDEMFEACSKDNGIFKQANGEEPETA